MTLSYLDALWRATAKSVRHRDAGSQAITSGVAAFCRAIASKTEIQPCNSRSIPQYPASVRKNRMLMLAFSP